MARRPYCTDDLTTGLRIRPLETALKHSHIQSNSPALRWRLVFDIDRPAAVFAAEDGGVATPNWIAENPRNGHAHLGYEIAVPLVTSEAGRADPLRFAAAIEYAYMEKLGADRGYVGLICKNPLHEQWRTSVQRVQAYDLAELAEWVDLPSRIPKKQLAESPLGRNVAVFDRLRHWAYRNIKRYEDSAEWKFACLMQATAFNSSFLVALPDNEVQHIAKSVSKWTWTRFDTDASDARFSKLQAHRGTLSGRSRAAKADALAIEARTMAQQGMTQRAIAEALSVTPRSVRNLLCRT
jgi:hypothetical protein